MAPSQHIFGCHINCTWCVALLVMYLCVMRKYCIKKSTAGLLINRISIWKDREISLPDMDGGSILVVMYDPWM